MVPLFRAAGGPRRVPFLVLGVLFALANRLNPCSGKVVANGGAVFTGNGWYALVDDPDAPTPYPPKNSSWKMKDTTIFVGVSAFRDRRCAKTLVNYFTKAKYPDRLRIGVVIQNDNDDPDCVVEYCKLMGAAGEGPQCPFYDNIRVTRIAHTLAAGPCFGRHLQSYMLRDEEFCMQTDSHMDVAQDWDQKLLFMWGRADNEYGVLATYVHRQEQIGPNTERRRDVPHLCQIMFKEAVHTLPDGQKVETYHPRYVQAKAAKNLPRPKLTNTWAAGFNLAKCHAWRAVPYDPQLRMVFDGEELSMHARLWTHGYDTYTPDVSLVGHDYNGVEDAPKPTIWSNNLKMRGVRVEAYARLHRMLGAPPVPYRPPSGHEVAPIGKYGLGDKRTLEQYQQFVGVNFTTLEIKGDRCGHLEWVPFRETWPPAREANRLSGPHWERRLDGLGRPMRGDKSAPWANEESMTATAEREGEEEENEKKKRKRKGPGTPAAGGAAAAAAVAKAAADMRISSPSSFERRGVHRRPGDNQTLLALLALVTVVLLAACVAGCAWLLEGRGGGRGEKDVDDKYSKHMQSRLGHHRDDASGREGGVGGSPEAIGGPSLP